MDTQNVRKLENGAVVISANDSSGKRIVVMLEDNTLKAFLGCLYTMKRNAAVTLVSSLFTLSTEDALLVVVAFMDSIPGKQMLDEFKSPDVSKIQSAQPAQVSVPKGRVPFVSRTSEGGVHITINNGGIDLHRGSVDAIVSAYSIGGEQAMAVKLRAEMHNSISEEAASNCVRAFLDSEVGRNLIGRKETESIEPRTGTRLILSMWSVALLAVISPAASNSGIRDKDSQERTKAAITRICGKPGPTNGAGISRRLFC